MTNQKQRLFEVLLVVFILLLPFQTRWIFYSETIAGQSWQYGIMSVYLSSLVLLLAAAVFLVCRKSEVNFSRSKFVYFIFAFSIVVSALSAIPMISYYYLILLYLAGIFAYLARFVPQRLILKAFVASGLIQSFFALWQIFEQKITANKWLGMAEQLPQTAGVSVVEFAGQRLLRAYGTLPHPNILAGVLFVGIFAAVYLWYLLYKEKAGISSSGKVAVSRKDFVNLIFIIGSLVLMSFAMLASFSRTGLLALAASLASVMVVGLLRKQWLRAQVVLKFSLLGLAIFLVFNSWFSGAWSARWQSSGRLEQQSIEQRIAGLQSFNFENWKHVLFGQGLGMNTYEGYLADPVDIVSKVQPIHNIFVLSLAEVGIVGLLIILQMLRYLFRKADNLSIMSSSFLLGLLVLGIFDHYLWTSWTGICLLFFGLINLHKTRQI